MEVLSSSESESSSQPIVSSVVSVAPGVGGSVHSYSFGRFSCWGEREGGGLYTFQ